MNKTLWLVVAVAAVLPATFACRKAANDSRTAAVDVLRLEKVPRAAFNQHAAELMLPLFWVEDRDGDGALDPEELAAVWGLTPTERSRWVAAGRFTPELEAAYARIQERVAEGRVPAGTPAEEAARLETVAKDLDQGRLSLLASDFTQASAEDRAIVARMLEAAILIERLYHKQVGSHGMEARIPAADTMSRLHFHINQGPWCSAPLTYKDERCSSVPGRPAELSGLYPASLQKDKGFCEALAKHPDAEALLDPFTVVVEGKEGALAAVPYTEVYAEEMQAISRKLAAAAEAIRSPEEAAFKSYLLAAAKAFEDNGWFAADEAWAHMSAQNSKWYLRVGPDETYFEPCSRKAGFHMSFARINQGSRRWQEKLDPVKNEMEQVLAVLAGAPYRAREVSFNIPDFIDVVLNAGDARSERGATIGQSLPNWGPVANEGRGRTVAMTNFYTDADNKTALRSQAASLFCADTMAAFTDDAEPQLLSTLLHEAAHNLGPSHEYAVGGKTDDQIFGGPMASVLEELKAQTAALFYIDWLAHKGLITPEQALSSHVRDVTWAFGHISRGMYSAEGKPKPYSQLAAVQMGFLVKQGALVWNTAQPAANGKDQGCFSLVAGKLAADVEKLANVVLGIKARGDKDVARALLAEHVDAEGQWKELMAVITERWQREPQATFLYAIDL